MKSPLVKLTVSVPRELVEITDEVAREKKASRSKVVAACLREMAEKRLKKELERGYREMAEENLRFANTASETVQEILPEWE